MDPIQTIALSMGAAWASGINLYATLLVLGIMNATGAIHLAPPLDALSSPVIMIAAGLMYFVEFFADKIPGLDSAWDAVHTFVRIPAGVVLAAAAIGPVNPNYQLAAALVGGALATSTHATKAGTRLLINASPEPVSNWIASITEDFVAVAGLWTALRHPWAFLVFLALFVLALFWLLPIIWAGLKKIAAWLRTAFKPDPVPDPASEKPGLVPDTQNS